MKEKQVVASANMGIGLWTSICVAFCRIFGNESKNYKEKQERVLRLANSRLEKKIQEIVSPVQMLDYRVTWSGSLSVTVSAIILEGEPKKCPKCGAIIREGMSFCGECGAKID